MSPQLCPLTRSKLFAWINSARREKAHVRADLLPVTGPERKQSCSSYWIPAATMTHFVENIWQITDLWQSRQRMPEFFFIFYFLLKISLKSVNEDIKLCFYTVNSEFRPPETLCPDSFHHFTTSYLRSDKQVIHHTQCLIERFSNNSSCQSTLDAFIIGWWMVLPLIEQHWSKMLISL